MDLAPWRTKSIGPVKRFLPPKDGPINFVLTVLGWLVDQLVAHTGDKVLRLFGKSNLYLGCSQHYMDTIVVDGVLVRFRHAGVKLVNDLHQVDCSDGKTGSC